jgi:isocitrate dehydrogenase
MESGNRITVNSDGTLNVPDRPEIPFIEGDGIGPDIWRAARMVIDSAIQKVYGARKKISWLEILAGEKGFEKTGNWLPDETLETIQNHAVAIKGPMTTPVGKGIRSINVAMRATGSIY